MAINQNHLFEELNGIKCSIVEKNAAPARVEFLKGILEYNGFTVIVVASPPPKAVAGGAGVTPAPSAGAAPVPASGAAGVATVPPAGPAPADTAGPAPAPETFTVGVTDVMFNAVNAIFGRLLRTRDGHVVTLAYWQQKEKDSHDEVPYFEK